MQTLNFDINGITCSGCTGRVQRALGILNGVSHADLTLRPGTATVMVDRDRMSPEQIQVAISHLGYSAKLRPQIKSSRHHHEQENSHTQ